MRLDQYLASTKQVPTRSQAESYIKLGYVQVNGKPVTKPGFSVHDNDTVRLNVKDQYVSRAALKLASIAKQFDLNFKDKTVLDVGSSTGGFTDYALKHGAKKVIAVEVGKDQMHPSLRLDPRIELHEQTDIRDFSTAKHINVVVADVSFISLRELLPYIAMLSSKDTRIVAMVKPQFEATANNLKHKGVIKNERMRRDILKDFETWAASSFVIMNKADSAVSGEKGNLERFYLLKTS